MVVYKNQSVYLLPPLLNVIMSVDQGIELCFGYMGIGSWDSCTQLSAGKTFLVGGCMLFLQFGLILCLIVKLTFSAYIYLPLFCAEKSILGSVNIIRQE